MKHTFHTHSGPVHFVTCPFQDVWCRSRWANDPVFKGYSALIPTDVPPGVSPDDARYGRYRLRNLHSVLRLALADLRDELAVAEKRGKKAVCRSLRRRIATLEAVSRTRKVKLPTKLRVRFCDIRIVEVRQSGGTTRTILPDSSTVRTVWKPFRSLRGTFDATLGEVLGKGTR